MSNEADDANTIFKITKGSIGKNNGGKVAWSKDHNTKLLELVNNYRGKCWKRVAKEMQEEFNDPELTAKKCRERWCNCTNPDIDKTALTESEELFLLIYHHEYKNKWVLISRHLPRRNSSKLKNNFSSLIRKVARKISLNEREVVLSANVYIQIIYASVLIYDLASIEDSPEKAIIIAPIHIYDHIKGKRLTCIQCLTYIKKITQFFISKYENRIKFQELKKLDTIELIRKFLDKIVENIKTNYSPNSPIAEPDLMNTIEVLLETKEIKPSIPIINQSVSPVPMASPKENLPFLMYQPPLKFDQEIPQIPELRVNNAPGHYNTYQLSPEYNFPMPTFNSPQFQRNMLSPPNKISPVSNQLLSSNYYSSIIIPGQYPMIRTPESSFMVTPQHQYSSLNPLIPCQLQASDFSSITNKYVL